MSAPLLRGQLNCDRGCCCIRPRPASARRAQPPPPWCKFFIVLGRQHRQATNNAVRVSDLNAERYLNCINCEQVNLAPDIFARHGTKVERVYRSDRDDWILAMVAAGLGFGFMPRYSITERPDIVVRPLVEPEFWREVSLVTVRGRPHSPAIGALVREAMRTPWLGATAPAVQKCRAGMSTKCIRGRTARPPVSRLA